MNKFTNFLRKSYIYLILAIVYVPLLFGVWFSFNQSTPKGEFNSYEQKEHSKTELHFLILEEI